MQQPIDDFSKLIPYTTLHVFDAWTPTALILMTQILETPRKARTALGFGFDPRVEKTEETGTRQPMSLLNQHGVALADLFVNEVLRIRR
jgi:hypothetical protein